MAKSSRRRVQFGKYSHLQTLSITPSPRSHPNSPISNPKHHQVKRHLKQTNGQGGIITMSAPLHYSNVMHVDPVTNGPVRVSWRFLEDGTRVRLTKGKLASESAIPLTITRKPTNKPKQVELGPRDTPIDDVREQTHQPGELPTMLNAVLDGSYIMKRHVGGTTSSGSGGGRRGGGRQQQARGFAASAFQ